MSDDSLAVYGILVLSGLLLVAVALPIFYLFGVTVSDESCSGIIDKLAGYICHECGCSSGKKANAVFAAPENKTDYRRDVIAPKPSETLKTGTFVIPNVSVNGQQNPSSQQNQNGHICGDGRLSIPYEQCDLANTKYANWSGAKVYGCLSPKVCSGCWCVITDGDSDGYIDRLDNCPFLYNPGQKDSDGDWTGDACDLCQSDSQNDIDDDGICGNSDNCPKIYNPGQEDSNRNKIGDACDPQPVSCLEYCSAGGYESAGNGISKALCEKQATFSYSQCNTVCNQVLYKQWNLTIQGNVGNSTRDFSCCCKKIAWYECDNCPGNTTKCYGCPASLFKVE